MADTPPPNPEPAEGGTPSPVAAERPNGLGDAFWDGEKKAVKWDDVNSAITERDALKAANTERAAQIPATGDAYKIELPQDFKLPDGQRFEVDPKDPMVIGLRQYAFENKLTQKEVSGLIALKISTDIANHESQQAFAAEQTKQLGEKAADRRKAAGTFIDSIFKKDDPQAAMLHMILDYAPGVGAIEAIMAKLNGIDLRGAGNGDQADKNAELKEQIGKRGTGLKLLNIGREAGK